MSLYDGVVGTTYTIDHMDSNDQELNQFLFRLGCFKGEKITLISKLKHHCIVYIKDARYSIDGSLAKAIKIA